MAWEREYEHLDMAEGKHIVGMIDRTVADRHGEPKRHILMIDVHHDACPHCGRVKVKDAAQEVDPRAEEATLLQRLEDSHAQMRSYAKRHNIQILKPKR